MAVCRGMALELQRQLGIVPIATDSSPASPPMTGDDALNDQPFRPPERWST